MKTVEEGVKYVPVADVVLVFLLLTLNILTPFSSASIADLEQVNVICDLGSSCIFLYIHDRSVAWTLTNV